jgi:regulatory protein
LNDGKFAEAFARSRVEGGYGRARILSDLAARGVDRRVAQPAVDAAAATDVDRYRVIEALARRRLAQLAHVPPRARYRRLVGFLLRRGFDGGEVVAVVRDLPQGPGGQ